MLFESLDRLRREARPEFWVILVLKCLESYSYFSISMNTTMYLTDEFGISDQDAGWMYGVFGVLISVAGLLCGQLIDFFGVKTSLVVGACLNAFGRLLFATSRSTSAICLGLFVFMPIGMALGIPVMTIAIKRYSTEGTRTMAFGVYYSVMNIAALASGPVTDAARASFKDGVSIAGADFSAVRLVFLTAVASTALVAVVAALALRDIPAEEGGGGDKTPAGERPSLSELLKEAMADPRFWRLMLFTGLMIGVRMVYRHLDATFPKYLTRELGKDAPYGTIYSLNPLIVVIGVPIVSAFTAHIPTFTMIKIGSFVTASSVFVLCAGASYTTAILFVIVLSVGESLYSPRTYQFVMSVAPNGKEGTFTSLASAPMFVAKLGAGGLSGWLLQTFCPATGPRSSGTMWLLVGLISILSPIGLVAFSSTIQPDGEDDGADRGQYGSDAESGSTPPSESTGLLSTGAEDAGKGNERR